MVHFQSKRQRSVSLSSCESETIAAMSIMSEGVFLQKLIERITGVALEARSSIVHRFEFVKTVDFAKRLRKSQIFRCLVTLDREDEASLGESDKGCRQPCRLRNEGIVAR